MNRGDSGGMIIRLDYETFAKSAVSKSALICKGLITDAGSRKFVGQAQT